VTTSKSGEGASAASRRRLRAGIVLLKKQADPHPAFGHLLPGGEGLTRNTTAAVELQLPDADGPHSHSAPDAVNSEALPSLVDTLPENVAMLFALHLPNHTLGTETLVCTTLAALAVAVVGAKRLQRDWQPASLGLIAATAAFVFAVQLVNFPLVDGRTSGHVLGTAAAAMLLGPWLGGVVIALVLAAQALLLGDGGTTALGANILNMAIVGSTAAYVAQTVVQRLRSDAAGRLLAAAGAGWASSVAAAGACAVELAVSGIGTPSALFAELLGHHAAIGVIEAIVTAAVVVPMCKSAPLGRRLRLAPVVAAAAIAFALTPFSSELPDSLEATLGDATVAPSSAE
jgi:cobalt/nickel transport system permease protein